MIKNSSKNTVSAGFTMIELVAVLAIMGVLALLVMPLAEGINKQQKETELRQALWQIREAIDQYHSDVENQVITKTTQSGYPPNLGTLSQGVLVINAKSSSSIQVKYYLRKIPRDPFSDRSLNAENTWRYRSYASPPDQPSLGEDVFDVFSSSNAIAIDGTKYSSW